jgi:AraC-like DNA-binding protein
MFARIGILSKTVASQARQPGARKNFLTFGKKGNMFHVHAFNPHPLLRQYVDAYLVVSADQAESSYTEYIFLPHVTQCLVFGLDTGNTVYSCNQSAYCAPHFISGPHDEVRRVRLFPGMKKIVVHFKPGGLFRIFHLPAQYFNNCSRDATVFLGKKIKDIAGLLRNSPLSRSIELMDNWLTGEIQLQKKSIRNMDEVIRLIELYKGNISISELEQATFTTKRTLERHFLEQFGLHPKTYSRLVRFNGVIRSLESNLNVKWRQLADAFGYYDQSHFIHEFKNLTGGLPQDYSTLKSGFEKIMPA